MANQDIWDVKQGERRRLKTSNSLMFANAMGDGCQSSDFRKLQANKKVQAEDDNCTSGDEIYNYYGAGDRACRIPPQRYIPPCDYCNCNMHYTGRCKQCWYYSADARQLKTTLSPLQELQEQLSQAHRLSENINREKAQEAPRQDEDKTIKDCCDEAFKMNYVDRNFKEQLLFKPKFQQDHTSDRSESSDINHRTYSNSYEFSDAESSKEKEKSRPQRVPSKPSVRSNGTARSKKADELMNLQKLKSEIIEVIQDGIKKIEKTTIDKPSEESQNIRNSATSVTNHNSSDVLHSDVLTTFVKQLRDNHLRNILLEVQNLNFLESLPERCHSDLNKRRDC